MGGRAVGKLLPRAAVPAWALASEGGAEVIGSLQVRRETQFLRFCFSHVMPQYRHMARQSQMEFLSYLHGF